MRYDDYDDYESLSRRRRESSDRRLTRREAEVTRNRTGSAERRSATRRSHSVEADMLADSRSTRTRSARQQIEYEEELLTPRAATRTHRTTGDSTRTAAGAAGATRASRAKAEEKRSTRTSGTKRSAHASHANTKAKTKRANTSYTEGYSEEELMSAERKRQKRSEKQKKAKKRRRRLIAIVALEAILLTAALAFIWVISKYDTIQKPNWGKNNVERNTAMDEQVIEEMKKGYTDIMVFGVDAGSTLDGGSGADVNILVHINNDTGEIKLVSFYRDLYLNTGGSNFRKLTDIYRRDGAEGALGAINMNMDLHVDQFVTVNWESIAETINRLGGIDVNVPDVMISQMNGYITETVKTTGIGSRQLKKGGLQHLDGIQTVAYCRIRKINVPGYSAGDYGRTERQREVIGLLLQKVKTCSLQQLSDITDVMLPNILTNVEFKDILGMLGNVFKYNIADSSGYPFNQVSAGEDVSYAVYSSNMLGDVDQLHRYLYGDDTGYEVSEHVKNVANKLYNIPGIR